MRGSIVKRGEKYSIVIYLGKNEFGKPIQKWFSGYSTKKEAERDLPRLLVKIQDGELIDKNKITFKSFVEEWLKNKIKKDDLSPTTIDGYENIVYNHLIPVLGALKIQDIKPYSIQKYVDQKSDTLSPKTLNNHKRVLSSIFIYATDMEVIEKNPMQKVKFPREKSTEVVPYDLNECIQLLDLIQDNITLSMPVTLSMFLGLRRGECLGLRWSDIDFKNNRISINQNLEYVKSVYYFKEPKTKKSKRTLAAPQVLMDYLKERQKWQKEMVLRTGGNWKNEYDLVCTRKDGQPITPHVLSDMFRVFLQKNGLKKIKFHDLRHTNATLMIGSGVNTRVAMQRLGHSKVSITLGLYSHVLEEMDRDAADRFDDMFKSNNKKLAKK